MFIKEELFIRVMFKISKICLRVLIFFTFASNLHAQDSLDIYNFEVLSKKINTVANDKRRNIYIKKYIKKAHEESDTLSLKAGHYYAFSYSNNDSIKIQHLDSIIKISETHPDQLFTPISYVEKGTIYRRKRDFKNALIAFLKANEHAEKLNNKICIFQSNLQIGIIKDRIGNFSEALKIHQENTKFAKENSDFISKLDYLNSVFALSFTYKNLKKIDSSKYYVNLGLKESKKEDLYDIYNYFLLNKGIILYYEGNLGDAEKKLNISNDYFKKVKNLPNVAESYFYLAKVQLDLNEEDKAILNLKKVDSIFEIMNDLIPEIRETYHILKDYYKNEKNIEKQLEYTQKLIQADSILDNNYIYISRNLKYKYDIPKFTKEKEELIKRLENKNKSMYLYYYILIFFSLVIMIFLFRRSYLLRKRFEALSEKDFVIEENQSDKVGSTTQLNIPENIVENIVLELKKFENEKKFTNSKITLSSLAKDFNTNTSYLSRTINHLKNKNLNTYLNDLRVEYAIHLIKTEKRFHNYTIRAIANEVGFKSPETFSKTFLKKTGLKPSYFIKKIAKTKIMKDFT